MSTVICVLSQASMTFCLNSINVMVDRPSGKIVCNFNEISCSYWLSPRVHHFHTSGRGWGGGAAC